MQLAKTKRLKRWNEEDRERWERESSYCNDYYDEFESETYGMYAGTYAQDIEGLSDEFIDDVLDGNPDAYWNID